MFPKTHPNILPTIFLNYLIVKNKNLFFCDINLIDFDLLLPYLYYLKLRVKCCLKFNI